jgi:2-polyprenyl-3-methyl-5-hydroxy-6-metoxy-1,4-benzoquinol methylase
VDLIESLLGSKPPARVLDLACGSGSATIELARRGYDVIGLDCTSVLLDVAREMAAERTVDVEWICADMRRIAYEEEMDYVLLRDVIFGVFEAEGEDRDLLRRMAQALKPEGKCLLEVYNKAFAQKHKIQNLLVYDESLDRFVLPDAHADRAVESVKLYPHEEWRNMLAESGLQVVQMDGWKWKDDPPPPPWRADYIVAAKSIR